MLAALRAGTYILAVRCRSCGAPLTNRESKALGIGPDCRRKAVAIGDSSDMAGGSPTPTFSSAPTKRSANEGAA
ncbi:DUF6011 domain-containing protein [Gordonia sp. ABSL11-1]|uniref:DUF6011 domain-containing protein n=1 Tax=Gordonia sp. ABSL11-1 TaxID=3053924 RepID=UPI0033656FD9